MASRSVKRSPQKSLLLGSLFSCSLSRLLGTFAQKVLIMEKHENIHGALNPSIVQEFIPFLALPHVILPRPCLVREVALPWLTFSWYLEHLVMLKWSYELLNFLNKQNPSKLRFTRNLWALFHLIHHEMKWFS